jgi:hypothetical protein
MEERKSAALRAMHDIEKLRPLSLETAMNQFAEKITLTLTYGLEQMGSLDGKRPYDTRECEGDAP